MTTSPKARFLADEKAARLWQDAADSDLFARASEAAMLVFQEELATGRIDAAEGFNRFLGARRFLIILRSIADKPVPTTPPVSHTLDHNLR